MVYWQRRGLRATRPLDLAVTAPGAETLQIWIDAGEQDPRLERDRLLDQTLTGRGVAHEWRILPGGHESRYWQRNATTYLRF